MKLDLGAAWNEAVAMMSANKEVLLVLGGIFFLLPAMLMAFLIPAMPQDPIQTMADVERLGEQVQAIYADWWWLYLLAIVIQMVGYLAILALLRDGRRPSVGEAIGDGAKALLPAIATYLLFTIGLSLVLALLLALTAATGGIAAIVTVPLMVIGTIYLAVKVSLSAPVIAVEKVRNPFTVLARSWKLTKGNSLRLFIFFLLIMIVYIVISLILSMIMALLGALMGAETGAILVAFFSSLVGAVFTIVMIAAIAAAHRQLAGPSEPRIAETFD
ncbi:hypothetical protein [Aurantiacibacter gangjinensis]|uniref:Glycerophosphoryl diester phosphodiesterase membrane domain-containing protein n=1 Tax=Aurantiacibacter gangjinensis TaxID=502682 RepID=A0A0G9MKI3_9SPHN|nr:hypothetical protein [Aurantiacibacter gangjinensis]KLE31195.1 hypothetical protein AAW01_12440 [Aurantiacibacter gangjinensis]